MHSPLIWRRQLTPSAVLIAALSLAKADIGSASNLNPSGTGCVDPQGFLSCYQAQVTQAEACVALCNKDSTAQLVQQCILGCGGYQLAGNIGCWVQSCWNQAYSCEYQGTAIQYLAGTDLVQASVNIPFYPPPDGVPGACSCNLGYVYGNTTYIQVNDPCFSAASTGDTETLANCTCCLDSLPVSNILNACPHSDLSALDFPATIASYQKIIASLTTDNCSILDTDSSLCVSSFGIQKDGPIWYNPLNLPAGEPGTQALSNEPGTPFTEFGAPTFTLQLFPGYSSVITPAPFNAANAAATETGSLGVVASGTGVASGVVSATGSGGGAGGGSGGGSGSGASSGASAGAGSTGSGTAPATPTKNSGGMRTVISHSIRSFIIVVGLCCVLALS